jgi:protein-tyrosine-phosphatase
MAEALLRHRFEERDVDANVHSAGLLSAGRTVDPYGVDAVRELGLDTSGYRSRKVTADMVGEADLVLCMARDHVREAVLLRPDAWARTFTLKELVRRGEEIGPRPRGQPFDEWLAKAHAGRSRADLLGASDDDDVADPIGLGPRTFRRTAEQLDDLVERLVDLAWGEE